MVTEEDGADRRALLRAAGATAMGVAAAAGLWGCGGSSSAESTHELSRRARRRDVELLQAALYLERRTVAAYTAGIPLLPRSHAKAAKQFLNEEVQHTGELIGLIKAAGGKFPPRPASFPIGHPRTSAEVLAVLHELERQQVAAYLQLIPLLAPDSVRAAVASVFAADAQHLTVLRLLQGLDPIPEALVTGRE